MKKIVFYAALFACMFLLMACSLTDKNQALNGTSSEGKEAQYEALVFEPCLQTEYANQFVIEGCGGYKRITIAEDETYLLVPENKEIPRGVPGDITILKQPFENTYLAASSAFDLLRAIDALPMIRFSGIKEQDMYIPEAVEKLQEGAILYAGKYSAPDYELLIGEGCNLAIESTMIYHNPQTKEKLQELNIPVLVEHSSYEDNPLGRLEWIKLYGVLFSREDEADSIFEAQKNQIIPILGQEKTGCKTAFFHVNSNGVITVRKPGDYIATMIELAGGEYALKNLLKEEENALSTMNIQVEDFYLYAKDADVLIYNSTIEDELKNMQDFLALNPVFSDFEAVKSGRVYCTGKNFFQETTGIGTFMEDLNKIFHGEDDALHYLWLLQK